MQTIFETLTKQISGEVLHDTETLLKYSTDKSPFRITPRFVIFPKNTEDVVSAIKIVASNKKEHPELSITARAAGSDVGGGPLSESIVIAFEKYMNNFSIRAMQAETQPGVLYRDFEKSSLNQNALLPSYPASRGICALGGMVANNAGGEKTLAFGKTDDYVTELEVVLDNGSVCVFSKLNTAELAEKLALKNREGEIYRKIYKLITENYPALIAAKPHVSKNSAGYALWNVWDPQTNTFDLTKLITGSQGTLGIITNIKLRLVQPKKISQILALFVNDLNLFPEIVKTVLTHKPEAFEVYDKTILHIIFKSFPSFVSVMGTNIFKLAYDFIPEFKIIASGLKIPNYILTAEFTGDTEQEVSEKIETAIKSLKGFPIKTHATRGAQEVKKYHTIRRESFSLLQKHYHNRQTVTFFDDLIVLPEKLPQFIPAMRAILDSYPTVAYSIFGHIGDGNFHIIPLMDLSDPTSRSTIESLTKEINTLTLSFHGSITAEHNDGLVRSPFLEQMYGTEIYKLFEQTKQIFDPQNIFNPGKKVHAQLSYALDHLKTSKS